VEQQNLVLILARELADKLATPMFVVDHEGRLAYFNERAGELLGDTFASIGRMELREWTETFAPADLEGRPLQVDELPLVISLTRREPAHLAFRVRARDGTVRAIAATAFPLFAHADEFVGAAAIFWEHREEPAP
jgi:PAS domain S-box-containing protein